VVGEPVARHDRKADREREELVAQRVGEVPPAAPRRGRVLDVDRGDEQGQRQRERRVDECDRAIELLGLVGKVVAAAAHALTIVSGLGRSWCDGRRVLGRSAVSGEPPPSEARRLRPLRRGQRAARRVIRGRYLGRARPGAERRGRARLGRAGRAPRPGGAGRGPARHGRARPGAARRGEARQGRASTGAWRGALCPGAARPKDAPRRVGEVVSLPARSRA
jgi:hypothetical protein